MALELLEPSAVSEARNFFPVDVRRFPFHSFRHDARERYFVLLYANEEVRQEADGGHVAFYSGKRLARPAIETEGAGADINLPAHVF